MGFLLIAPMAGIVTHCSDQATGSLQSNDWFQANNED
jgi:hypothetical protein